MSWFHRPDERPGGVDGGLGGVDRAADAEAGGGVQAEGAGDPGHLSGGEHEAQTQQGVILEYQEARHQDSGLQKRRQAQGNDLFDPLDKAVRVAPGDREHIEAPHGDLDEQDAAPLEVAEKHFDHRVSHKDDAEEDHDGACDGAEAEVAAVDHLCHGVDLPQLRNDLLAHGTDAGAVAGEAGGEGSLEGDRQGVQPHGDGGKQAHGQKALQDIHGCLLDICPAG